MQFCRIHLLSGRSQIFNQIPDCSLTYLLFQDFTRFATFSRAVTAKAGRVSRQTVSNDDQQQQQQSQVYHRQTL